MAKTDTSIGEVILTDVRLSFANLFTRGKDQVNDKGEKVPGKYGCSFLFSKKTPEGKALCKKLQAVAEAVKLDKWPKNTPKFKPDKVFLRDGDLEDYDGYAGMFYVSANNAEQPVLVDRVKGPDDKWAVLTKENGGPKKLYSGCYVRALIRVWAQDNDYGKRLNASVESVQFLRHGEAFSGAAPVDPNEKFDDLPDEELDGEQDAAEDDDTGLI